MKKLLTIALVLALVLGLTACGYAANNAGTDPGADPGANSGTNPGTDPGTNPSGDPEAARLDGSLCFIDGDDRDSSVLRGVRFSGNRSGSEEFNHMPPATSGIRCVFEMNEWVAAMPDTDVTSGILVYVLPHRADQKYYETAQFSGDMPDLAAVYDMEHIDGEGWGAFYLNPEEAEAGYYDFVFVYEGKAIATLLTRFYDEGALENLTDKELYECMNSWETAVFTG